MNNDRKWAQREQVRYRMYEAQTRVNKHLAVALETNSGPEYERQVGFAAKAANDYNVWKTVLESLNQL